MKWLRAGAGIGLMMIALSIPGMKAQNMAPDGNQQAGVGRNGVHIYDATAGVGYSSLVASPSVGQNLAGLGGEGYAIGSISVGYSRDTARTTFNILYTPSYISNFGFAQFGSFNQSLDFSLTRQVNTRWTLMLSGSVDDSTIDQFLFDHSAASVAAAGGASAGLSDPGALVPGVSASPQLLLYGSRVLMASGMLGVTYRPSPRLRWYLGGNVMQSQGLDNGKGSNLEAVFPSTTAEQGTATVSYSLNPLTEIGADATLINAHTVFGNYQSSTFLGRYSRKLNQRWSVSLSAGVSAYTSQVVVREGNATTLATDDRIRYDRREHHFSFGYSRVTGDAYGLASSATESYLGTWGWNRPGRSWSLNASGGLQRFATGPLGTVDFWQVSSGLSHTLGHHAMLEMGFVYMRENLGPAFGIPDQSIRAVRMTVSWVPFLKEALALANHAGGGADN